ncbi:hypothetical protein SCARD494_13855 [Seiridium cardinale]
MVAVSWSRTAIFLALSISQVRAIDPSPADKKVWDDKCKAKLGGQYFMVFDVNGKPTGTCNAPPFQACYWGPYTDPKTGQQGCCGKNNTKGQFSTDPVAIQEGGCCVAPNQFSFDDNARRGACCPQGQHISWDISIQSSTLGGLCCEAGLFASVDKRTSQQHCCPGGLSYSSDPNTGNGDCCEPGKTFSFDAASQKGECCAAGSSYSVDPVTGAGSCCGATESFKCDCKCIPGDVNPNCPADHGQIIQNGGKKWKIFCGLINHGENDISITPNIPSWGQCITNCANTANCVRAIYQPSTMKCFLRSHGNTIDATFPDSLSSAHLVEDDATTSNPSSGTDTTDTGDTSTSGPPTTNTDLPKHCPEIGGKIVEVDSVTYEISCTNGIIDSIPDYRAVQAKDANDCMSLCSADPQCQGANFWDDATDAYCVMVSEYDYPARGTINPQDVNSLMSMIPIKKR